MNGTEKAIQELESHDASMTPIMHSAIQTAIAALKEKAEREKFNSEYFNEMWKICSIVYKEKPEVKSFNRYVAGLIEKDLGRKLVQK